MSSSEPVALKGRVMSFTVLHVYGTDIQQIQQILSDKVAQAPDFFRQVPIVIQPHQDDWPPTFLAQLLEILNQLGFVPIGIQTTQPAIQEQASFLGLALFPKDSGTLPDTSSPDTGGTSTTTAPQQTVSSAPALIVHHTVRSGQQIYAQGRDLVVMGTVNPGGEVYADGHIHIYGRLRGRAFAGARGDSRACIFVQNLQAAEMVCIAGLYQLAEDIPDSARRQPCMITLQQDTLHYQPLKHLR